MSIVLITLLENILGIVGHNKLKFYNATMSTILAFAALWKMI